MPVPIEVVIFGWQRTSAAIERLGGRPVLREREGVPFRTDEGHYILDTRFEPIADPERLAAEIKSIVGVVEHGLFIGLADRVIVAGHGGVQTYDRQ
jgi:ribose 5-phosphate isomerase A